MLSSAKLSRATLTFVKIIVGHLNPDFDALASLALARLAHPGAVAVVSGGMDSEVEALVRLYEEQLELRQADDLDLAEVEELIIVDTSSPERITPFDALLGRVPVTLYDHHPRPENAIPAAHGVQREIGATASLLTLLLKSQDTAIPEATASLALLGIHDDTGSLSYDLTRPEDHEAAAHLLRSRASVAFVRRYLRDPYSEVQRELFGGLLKTAEQITVSNRPVVLGRLQSDSYIADLAPLCTELLELYSAEAALVLARMDGKTFVIARASDAFDVGAALAEAFGGGGHRGAAFAQTDLTLDEAEKKVLDALSRHGREAVTARDIMSWPVTTVLETATLREARTLLERNGHHGAPVVTAEDDLVGLIDRRTLDKAAQHELSDVAVKGFMRRKLVTATPTASLSDLENLVQENDVGRILILKNRDGAMQLANLAGIVTRSDLIAAHHRGQSGAARDDAAGLLERLPHSAQDVIQAAREVLEPDVSLYVVGGTVRDAVLGVSMQDLDLSVEKGRAETLGTSLQRRLGGELSCHFDFGTCTLKPPSGLVIDIATARGETYAHPGALPTVTPGGVAHDLARRDFTLNALAIHLETPPKFIDPYGGLRDLEAKQLRTLHPLSFIEDPTRILRGARLAGRLGLHFEEDTLAQIPAALSKPVLERVSASRLRSELELTLSESVVTPALRQLDVTGALKAMFGMKLDAALTERLDTFRQNETVPDESYLLALLLGVPERELAARVEAFHLPRRYLAVVRQLRAIKAADDVTREELEISGTAEKALIKVFSEQLEARVLEIESAVNERKLRGQDVLDLGLLPGPEVGEVLKKIAQARHRREVTTFDEELALARRLVRALDQQEQA